MRLCICGHPEGDHVFGGPCRVPECPCDRFQPIPEVADKDDGVPQEALRLPSR